MIADLISWSCSGVECFMVKIMEFKQEMGAFAAELTEWLFRTVISTAAHKASITEGNGYYGPNSRKLGCRPPLTS